MQPTMCSRCHKNVAVIFITKLEGGETKNEGLCLKCARELGIKPIDDMMKKMGISDEDLDNLTNEMMSAFGGAEGMEGLMAQPNQEEGDEDDGRTDPGWRRGPPCNWTAGTGRTRSCTWHRAQRPRSPVPAGSYRAGWRCPAGTSRGPAPRAWHPGYRRRGRRPSW